MSDDNADVPATAGVPLAAHTTLRLGGPARELVIASNDDEIIQSCRQNSPALILAGGSNVVIGDAGVAGRVLLVRSRGIAAEPAGDGHVRVTAAAGEPWDDLVAATVAAGYRGLECLSGIPGSTGATPIQNVGAYGQEVAGTVAGVRVYDRAADEVRTLDPAACGFGYRHSVFKRHDRYVVLGVAFRLRVSGLSAPLRYAELAAALGVAPGGSAPLADVRAAVLALRAGKGMVLDPADRDTYSVGSFFMNPVLDATAYAALAARCPDGAPRGWPGADGAVKLSAAWLIERAGYARGYTRGGGVAVSGKHTLALTHRGGGSTAALLDLAADIRAGVQDRFGVRLDPEPVLVNCAL
ncbi:UDP-N-acetylenolpyruvoylglucosamine reductase [Pilimelia terevasa]|uniref:UDP-N-acetylenolpyruvoylglucosamine reductase n=1 Tax=Pilimelia terevasa TaxID=53372 RepID=A0A8J3BUK7_9ACTN|nr:UDP-N-acetylmuramate dehydrogenase [Pilimelia terevasa]GGK29783.1 UDP-N-acetylenolpyruvoylglucosamine reductase [Pilimelia terevasa]